MTKSVTLACTALALGLFAVPAAQAMDNAGGMSKMSGDAMTMHKDGMKKHKKNKDGMMGGGNAMKGNGMMKKDDATPSQ